MKRTSTLIFLLLSIFLTSLLAPSDTFASLRSLSLGMSGSDVTQLQNDLISLKYLATGNNTAYFGAKTQTALKKFQCEKNILCAGSTEDGYGVYGPKTQATLQIALAPDQPANLSNSFLTGNAKGTFEFSGWIPGWRTASSTADTLPHLNQLNSVMPFGYKVLSDGTISDIYNIGKEPWTSFMATAKAQKVRVVPSLFWGSGTEIHAILSDTKKRIALEDAIAKLVKENNFDGIDIDFEAKKAESINYFSTFLKGLYQRMGSKWVYCTIEARMPLEDRYSPGATIPPDATDYANDYTQMNKYCDRVEIMAYDQGTIDVRLNAARSAPYAPVADPLWVAELVNVAAQSIAKNKLIIGIPTYGYEYTVTPLANGGEQYKMLWAFNPAYATGIATQLGITPTRTSANEIGFTYDPKVLAALAPVGSDSTQTQQVSPLTSVAQNLGSQVNTAQPFNFMTWSDATAIADKIALAHQLGVRGVAFFSLGGAEDQRMWSILK